MKYECLTHRITVAVEGNRRDYDTPPGSWGGVPQCKLLTMKEIREGSFGPCQIVKKEAG